jgi:iron complex outermembrane receptor protein
MAAGRFSGTLLAGFAFAAGAHAQQAAAPPIAPAPAPGLEQVVVTAQHRPEYQKNVPLAVTSLSNRTVDVLTASGEDIRVLSARVPSLYIESSFGRIYPRFYIRGLGNSDFTYNAQQPVSVVYDDVVVENAVLKAFPLFDIQDVEVLRGPQGTLFGRNTPAGVVKVESKRPTDDTNGYADLSYGTFNTVDFNGAVGGAIIPGKLDYRLSILDDRRDNWVTNLNPHPRYNRNFEGYNDFAGRGQLLFKANDDLDILLDAHGRSLDGTARVFRADIIQPGTNHLVLGFKVDQVNLDGDNYQRLGSFGTHVTINDDLGPVRLTSITAYEHATTDSRGDIDGGNFTTPPAQGGSPGQNYFSDETSDSIPNLDQLTQELRVSTTGDGRFFNQGGVFLFHEFLRVNSFDYITATGATDITLNQTQQTNALGVFDAATYKITPDLTAGAGLRLSTEHKTFYVACPLGCAAPDPSTVKTNYTGPSFNVDLTWAVTPQANIYGRIASGFLAPALDGRNVEYDFGNKIAGELTEAQAETTTSYETGLKSNLLGNTLNVNLTAFRWDTDNLQLTAVGGANQSTNLLNAKHAIGEGFEGEFDYAPVPPVLLTASGSYNYTEIQDSNLQVAPCAAPCTVLNPPGPKGVYINGNPLPNAPRFVLQGSARYTIPIADARDLYVLTDWSYRSSVDFFLYRATEFKGQSLVLGGLRVGYIDHQHGFEIAGFVRNILDQVRVTGAIDFDNLTGFVNDPRTFGVEGRVRF